MGPGMCLQSSGCHTVCHCHPPEQEPGACAGIGQEENIHLFWSLKKWRTHQPYKVHGPIYAYICESILKKKQKGVALLSPLKSGDQRSARTRSLRLLGQGTETAPTGSFPVSTSGQAWSFSLASSLVSQRDLCKSSIQKHPKEGTTCHEHWSHCRGIPVPCFYFIAPLLATLEPEGWSHDSDRRPATRPWVRRWQRPERRESLFGGENVAGTTTTALHATIVFWWLYQHPPTGSFDGSYATKNAPFEVLGTTSIRRILGYLMFDMMRASLRRLSVRCPW